MAGEITIHQLWQTPFIRNLYSLLPTPDMVMQRYYGAIDSGNREFTPVRNFGWDIFNVTRTVATMKTPMTAPSTIRRTPIGTRSGVLLRVAEKQYFYDEEFMHLRPPGSPIGTLDQKGQRWVTQQIKNMTQRHRNLMEISFSRMLQGGFGIKVAGEMYYLTELNAVGNIANIDMGVPSTHMDDLDGIITEYWDDPGADILGQLTKLRQRAIAESGYDLSVAWTDSITIAKMMQNASLAEIRGSATPAFKTWEWSKPAQNVEPSDRTLGSMQAVVFSALPWMTWFVNDAYVSLGTSSDPQGTDSFNIADLTRVVPAGRVLFTPPANGDWYTVYEGEEPVRMNWGSSVTTVRGFGTWEFPHPGSPPSREANMIDNFLPVLRFPRAVWNAKVRDASADHT